MFTVRAKTYKLPARFLKVRQPTPFEVALFHEIYERAAGSDQPLEEPEPKIALVFDYISAEDHPGVMFVPDTGFLYLSVFGKTAQVIDTNAVTMVDLAVGSVRDVIVRLEGPWTDPSDAAEWELYSIRVASEVLAEMAAESLTLLKSTSVPDTVFCLGDGNLVHYTARNIVTYSRMEPRAVTSVRWVNASTTIFIPSV